MYKEQSVIIGINQENTEAKVRTGVTEVCELSSALIFDVYLEKANKASNKDKLKLALNETTRAIKGICLENQYVIRKGQNKNKKLEV